MGVGAGFVDIIHTSTDEVLHVWLSVSRQNLADCITRQVVLPGDPERDAEVRAWRLAQIDGAMTTERRLGADTLVRPTDDVSPRQLAERILA